MMSTRIRFWLEVVLAALAAGLLLLTLASPTWIESVFGLDPDQDTGSLEWLLAVALLVTSMTLILLARADWRKSRLSDA